MKETSIKSLIRDTFLLFFKNFSSIAIIVLVISIPVELIKNYYFVSKIYEENILRESSINGLVGIVFLSLISPTIIYFIYKIILGNNVTIGESLLFGLKKWPKIIVYGFMKNLLIVLGLMVLIVPGIIFSIRLLFLNLIITLEDTKNVLRRSKLLSKGILLNIILSVLFLTVIIAVPFIILGIGVYLIIDGWLGDAIFDVLIDLTVVLYIILTLLIYLEQIKEIE